MLFYEWHVARPQPNISYLLGTQTVYIPHARRHPTSKLHFWLRAWKITLAVMNLVHFDRIPHCNRYTSKDKPIIYVAEKNYEYATWKTEWDFLMTRRLVDRFCFSSSISAKPPTQLLYISGLECFLTRTTVPYTPTPTHTHTYIKEEQETVRWFVWLFEMMAVSL